MGINFPNYQKNQWNATQNLKINTLQLFVKETQHGQVYLRNKVKKRKKPIKKIATFYPKTKYIPFNRNQIK